METDLFIHPEQLNIDFGKPLHLLQTDCLDQLLDNLRKFTFNVDPEKLVNSAIPNKIINVAIRDEIERIYEGDEEELKVNLEVLLSLRKERKNR